MYFTHDKFLLLILPVGGYVVGLTLYLVVDLEARRETGRVCRNKRIRDGSSSTENYKHN